MSEPKGFVARIADALDERVGFRKLTKEALDEPIPGGARWSYVFGSALLVTILIQMATGWLLMTAYSPSAQTAWSSVHYISNKMSMGWLVRGIHHWGSGATIVLLGAHLAQTALFGAYKRPREMNWWFGLVLMGIVLGFSLTGYLLPWDQKGYWATRVATNIMGTTPVVGGAVQTIAQGGSKYGHLTLTRFYALHVGVLPVLLLVVLGGHVALFRKHGVTPPASADTKKVDRFFPKQLAFDVLAALAVFAVVLGLAIKHHGADLDAPADPSSDYPARPEWYFLSLFQLLKYFHGPLEIVGTMVVPGLAVGFLVALPLLDKKPGTALRDRKPWIAALLLGFGGVFALTALAYRADANDEKFKKARTVADERAKYANELAMNGVPPEGPLEMLARDPLLRGEEIWKKECATCHTFDGKGGGDAPDLQGWGTAAWVEHTVRDPDSALRFAKTPFKGEMPSATKPPPGKEADFKPMPDADVKAVSAFVAGEKNPRGAEVFENACGGCHALFGKGGEDSELAPDLGGWGSYRWLRSQIANPAAGDTYKPEASSADKKGHMPAFASSDIKDEIDVIAKWVFFKSRGRWPTAEETAAASIVSTGPAPSPSTSASTTPSGADAPPATSASAPAAPSAEASTKGKGAPPAKGPAPKKGK